MPATAPDERTLKSYLLGELSQEREESVDNWILATEDAEALLSAAEDDLIDDSIEGRLNATELNRFTNYFLQTAERHQKFQFGRILQRAVQNSTRTKETPVAAPRAQTQPSPAWWTRLFQVPAFGLAMTAAVLLLAGGMTWSSIRFQTLFQTMEQRLDTTTSERDSLQTNLKGAEAAAEDLRSQMTAYSSALAGAAAALPLELSRGALRSADSLPEVSISGSAALRVSLLVQGTAPGVSYRAALVAANGHEIGSGFPAVASPKSPNLTVMLPTGLLASGEYSLKLMGTSGSEQESVLGLYYFSVRR